MPDKAPKQETEEALPELKPEPLQDDGLPRSISAAQSAALLKTLDELAGSDIRIEDTGVEWRVLDDESGGNDPVIDEVLDESPTPIDQFLTETPAIVDSPEIFEEAAAEVTRTPIEELRFDDNTPLPDDFDLDEEPTLVPQPPAEPELSEPEIEEGAQPEFDLSEPEEWTDILGEFEDLAGIVATPTDDGQDESDELDEPDEPDEPDEETATSASSFVEPPDMDTQFALQAAAMGIDLSGMHETQDAEKEFFDGTADEVDDDEDEDETIVDEVPDESLADEDEDEDETIIDEVPDESLADEVDDDEEVEAEILEPDLVEGDAPDYLDAETDESPDELQEEADEDLDEEAIELADDVQDELDDDFDEEPGEERDETPQELVDALDEALVELEETEAADNPAVEEKRDDEFEYEDNYVAPMTEEEQTINMQIDQDLLALAIEDQDGFASTMVLTESVTDDEADEETDDGEAEEPLKDTAAGFETIVMEGEFVRGDRDKEKLAADAAAAASLAGAAAAERAAENAAQASKRRNKIIGGIALLTLLLVVQFLHQSRETLATFPAFNRVVGPMYRAIGKPLSPEWDIAGWRFEATKGSTDENDQDLTIYSRLGNKSDKPLPYPLIGISLTDRFEESIGSRILDPGEYLPDDLDPRKLVAPGNTFDAVITIQSPAAEATGFKLNVCYRESGGNLRCAIDDFK